MTLINNPLVPVRGRLMGAIPAVVPFSIRETPSVIYTIEEMRKWINDTLVPFVNENIEALSLDWVEQSEALLKLVTDIAAGIGDDVAEAEAAKVAAEAAAALAEQFASTIVAIQDSAVSGLVGDDESATREILNTLFASHAELTTISNDLDDVKDDLKKKLEYVMPQNFGAIGDGVADDTVAIKAFFNHLVTNGGMGVGEGTFRITAPIVIGTPGTVNVPFTFSGSGKGTVFLADFGGVVGPDSRKSVFNLIALNETLLENFAIDSLEKRSVSHGISAASCTNVTTNLITVRNYTFTAIMFFFSETIASLANASYGNRIISCTAFGENAARNGFMHESATHSAIVDCDVFDLDPYGDPGYGLQLKNGSSYCSITGGTVTRARAAVGFGTTLAKTGYANTVIGVTAFDCAMGIQIAYQVGTIVDMAIDMNHRDDNFTTPGAEQLPTIATPIWIASGSNGLHIKATIVNAENVPNTIVQIGGGFHTIELPNIMSTETGSAIGEAAIASFASGAQYNTVKVGNISGLTNLANVQVPVIDNANNSSNNIIFDSSLQLHSVLSGGSSVLRFTAPGNANSVIQYSHGIHRYTFRANGIDVLLADIVSLRPGAQDGIISLGVSAYRWKEGHFKDGVVVTSPNNSKWRLTVNNAGAVTATAV